MGRSAKLHKRVKKTVSSTSQAVTKATKPSGGQGPAPAPAAAPTQPARTAASARPKSQKNINVVTANANVKRTRGGGGLKQKAAGAVKNREGGLGGLGGHVLGGADYVSLMMGGRRKAREEAERLPQS